MQQQNDIEQNILLKIQHRIHELTGIKLDGRTKPKICKAIYQRMSILEVDDVYHYEIIISGNNSLAINETVELASLIANMESYFFRDKNHVSLLSNRILPELVRKNDSKKSLRIWSAGCSTGEEPYSISIFLSNILPNWQNWDILILGTDIDKAALKDAEVAVYSEHSLWGISDNLRERLFSPTNRRWQLKKKYIPKVVFAPHNLVQDGFPILGTKQHDMDLILCRNVFIYFMPETIELVIDKLFATLRAGGYLLTGHGEIKNSYTHPLIDKVVYPEGIIYRKREK